MSIRSFTARRVLFAALIIGSGWACTETLVSIVTVESVEIEPPAVTLFVGDSLRLDALLHDEDGNALDGRGVEWSSAPAGVVNVDSTGMLRALAHGSATVTASAEGVQGMAEVTVLRPPVIVAEPDTVALIALLGDSETPSSDVAIVNGGDGDVDALSASIEYDEGAAGWLEATLTVASAPATLTLAANAADLEPGPYAATVLIDGTAQNTPVEVRVLLDVVQPLPAPTLASAAPSQARPGDSLDVALTGSGFVAEATTVDFGAGVQVLGVVVDDSAALRASIRVAEDAALGARAVTVTNPAPGGGTATLATGFNVVSGVVSPTASTVTITPSTVLADGVTAATGTIELRDAEGVLIGGVAPAQFVVFVSGSARVGSVDETATSGTYTFAVTDSVAETVNVTVSAAGVLLSTQPAVEFIAGAVSASESIVTAAPSSGVVADGSAASTVTVLLRDANGNAVAGLASSSFTVSFTGSGEAEAGAFTETAPGTYRFPVTSRRAEVVVVTVEVGGLVLDQKPAIQFVAGAVSAERSSVAATPDVVPVGQE